MWGFLEGVQKGGDMLFTSNGEWREGVEVEKGSKAEREGEGEF